jgi:signal peptidase II
MQGFFFDTIMKQTNRFIYFYASAFLVLLDQATKIAVKGFSLFGFTHEGMYLGESFPVVGELLRCTFVENPGMAFGISFGAGKILLTLATIAIALAIAWYLRRAIAAGTRRIVLTGVMLVFSGAVGNLIDRMFYGVFYNEGPLFYGKVVDFIQVDIPDITIAGEVWTHWPVFNVADSCVTVGVVLLLFFSGQMPSVASLRSGGAPLEDPGTDGTV